MIKTYYITGDKIVINNIIEVAEKEGFKVSIYNCTNNSSYGIEFYKMSSQGRDFGFEITMESGMDEHDVAMLIDDYFESFDVSYETYIWLDNEGHGKNGAPYDMLDCYNDTKQCEKFIEELSEAILKVY